MRNKCLERERKIQMNMQQIIVKRGRKSIEVCVCVRERDREKERERETAELFW